MNGRKSTNAGKSQKLYLIIAAEGGGSRSSHLVDFMTILLPTGTPSRDSQRREDIILDKYDFKHTTQSPSRFRERVWAEGQPLFP
jgi:hypothetical protein